MGISLLVHPTMEGGDDGEADGAKEQLRSPFPGGVPFTRSLRPLTYGAFALSRLCAFGAHFVK